MSRIQHGTNGSFGIIWHKALGTSTEERLPWHIRQMNNWDLGELTLLVYALILDL